MANSKLTKSLRNSIAAETKSVDQKHSTKATPQAKPAASSAVKPAVKDATVKAISAKATAKKAAAKPPVARKPAPSTAKSKATSSKGNLSKSAVSKSPTRAPAKAAAPKLADNLIAGLAHNKLHKIVETNYNFYGTYLENLQKINNNLHDYLNKLVEINNVNSLIKLNLSYLSSAPVRYQEMIAQNKNIFSDFFKFTLPKE